MKMIDQITTTVRDDIIETIHKGSKVSIAAACFSIYAYQELKAQLESVEEIRFIFTSPTFIEEKTPKEKKEFYIPRISRERSLYGTEFEIKLRNELTQKAIARECADWIRRKVRFRSNTSRQQMMGFINVDESTYMPVNGFTTVDLGCERGNNAYYVVNRTEAAENGQTFLRLFDEIWNDPNRVQDVTELVVDSISTAYRENAPEFIYFFTLYNIFSTFLEDISEDNLPNEATGFKDSQIWKMLYNFQRDAALAIINKLETFNGCILADSVGLGKTFTALAVIKYYENRNKSVLVLCPKKLSENWMTYKSNYVNNPIAQDRLRYDVLYHTDLSREHGFSGQIDLSRINWGNYDLVVIDESHNFRNGGSRNGEDERENRYLRLMNRVIRAGVKTKVLMLSATPVNNRFTDLRNQLALAYEGDASQINAKLNTTHTIDEIFRSAQKAFNAWSKLPAAQRTTEALLKTLDFDFFEVLDSVTIARSRRHIERYYSMTEIGKFPERLKPISCRPHLTDMKGAIHYNDIYEILMLLNLSVYTPSNFILPSKAAKYYDLTHNKGNSLTQMGREEGIRRLMSINLLKRLESSVYSFQLTLERIRKLIADTIEIIHAYQGGKQVMELPEIMPVSDFDDDDQNTDFFTVGKKVRIDIADMDYTSWLHELKEDAENLELLTSMVGDITPEHDTKLQTLLELIRDKQAHPINPGNRKLLIFTAFSDTADYLYQQIAPLAKAAYGLNCAEITGTVEGKTTIPRLRADLNTVLTCFSPISKGRDALGAACREDIDILIATDCISEGQNLQDCDYVVNYDIHWNPVRIIQRFGRIDRIGSKNACIQLVNFWPDMDLDEYINLKARVETRMKITVMTATGDDDLINEEEKGDLEYRRAQLKRLQEEVVDLEDMSSGVSIMDLGLNEFRMDLLEYVKHHDDLEGAPRGMHAVVPASEDMPAGAIFVLKNISNAVNIDNQNRLHPYYMVYVSEDGEVVCDHLSPKDMLDKMRYLCKGRKQPNMELCRQFNRETRDGKDMQLYSELLSEAIDSIIHVKEESELDAFMKGSQVSFLSSAISGLEDFELIGFLVVEQRR